MKRRSPLLEAKAGTKYYPVKFEPGRSTAGVIAAIDAIPECKTGQANKWYLEFPITDPTFTGGVGGSQGPDRVIAIMDGTAKPFTNPQYCLSLTHRGEVNNAFAVCT